MAAKRLTSQSMDAMKAPTKGNLIDWDTQVVGLGARITAAGARSFVLRFSMANREQRMTLGPYPDLNVSAARDMARRLKGDIAHGVNPLNRRREERGAATMEQLCADYLERHAKPKKRPACVADDTAMIDTHIRPRLGKLQVAKVTHRNIEDLHHAMAATPYRANRCLALLSKMFSLAVKWQWRADNPVRGIERHPEHRRERWLSTEELAALATALDAYSSKRAADAIRLLMFTGARRREVLAATWDQFDLERGTWTKPHENTKQKKEHRVPLSPPARTLLSRMRTEAVPGTAYLFPGDALDAEKNPKPLQDIKRAWLAVCRTAGLAVEAPSMGDDGKPELDAEGAPVMLWKSTVRLHDLRHTYASHLVSSGLSLPIIGKLLGHTQAATTQRYAHLADDPLREATSRFAAMVQAAQSGKTAEIVQIPQRSKGGA